MLEQPLEKKTGTIFGPPGTKKLVYFIDDINMPTPDKYGTQSAIALLRQQVDYGGFYDLKKLTMKEIDNVQYVAAMNPTAGSFFIIDRMQRHFATFATPFPEAEVLAHIYGSILGGPPRHTSARSRRRARRRVPSPRAQLHKEVADAFLPTAVKFHYQWNLRALSSRLPGHARSRRPTRTRAHARWRGCGCTRRSASTATGSSTTPTSSASTRSSRRRRKAVLRRPRPGGAASPSRNLFATFVAREDGDQKIYYLPVDEGDRLKKHPREQARRVQRGERA